jgi:hypothetical protein
LLRNGKEDVEMAVSTAAKTTTTDESAMRSVAAAMRDAATTASEETTEVEPSAGDLGSDAMQWLSRMTYTGSYVLAYGVVYAAVFIAQSLPQENPIMHGFRDGGRAAADQLDDG